MYFYISVIYRFQLVTDVEKNLLIKWIKLILAYMFRAPAFLL